MWSSRLFWKLLLACAGLSVVASIFFAYAFSNSWNWGLAAIVGACVVALSWWIAEYVVRPIHTLSNAAKDIAEGRYDQRVFVGNRDELGTLARTLHRVSQQLDERRSQVGQTGDRQSTVLQGMIEGVIAVDPRQRIVLANQAAGKLFDFRSQAVEGRPLLEVVRNHALHQAVSDALATREPQRLETKSSIQSPASAVHHVDIHVQPLPGEPCPGVVLVMHDTTELRRLESMRRDFMANVSHELKTPLSSIKAYTETLRDGALHDTETAQRFLSRIEEQADRLHHLILDMLMLARIESEEPTFELVSVDVSAVVADCLRDRRQAAEAKRITLSAETDDPDCRVRADREGLREILDNLIDNAIKYTPESGAVSVAWRRIAAGSEERGARDETEGDSGGRTAEGQEFVAISVRDTGVGIKPEDQRRVFERFYRVDKARSRDLGGTGLGLAIVKHLAQSFGGNVEVSSEYGKGSVFTATIPLA